MRDNLSWLGEFQIAILSPNERKVVRIKNLITDAGLNYFIDLLRGAIGPPIGIRYVALGTSNTQPSTTDVKLGNEFFRKAITKQETIGTGQLQSTWYIAPFEANDVQIEEIGIFAGPDATSTKDSGILVARVLWQHTKNQLESLQIVRTDTIGRV